MTDEELIRAYYDHFNARRLADAAALLADDAHLEHRNISLVGEGSDNYAVFARRWLDAFPDLQLTIERIDRVGDEWHEVYLVGDGTHRGDFDMGPLGTLKATGRHGRLRLRHLLRVRQGRIASSTLSFDTNAFIQQIARP
ncbi:MAG TPA: ester cyclase [Vicinamibacterales bacterium]|jgi:predicted ester cyclase|nr:ester cyclase [Vicinamibacterales bacterium]